MSKTPSARAPKTAAPEPAPAPAPEPKETARPIKAFAVVETTPGEFRPMLLTIQPLTKFEADPLHEPTIYEAVAYEYLQGDVRQYYETLQILRSKE